MRLTFLPIHDISAFSFRVEDDYHFLGHWRGTRKLSPGHLWYEVRNSTDTQVALLDLDQSKDRAYWQDSVYPIAAEGPKLMEIQFIDVRSIYRSQKIGTAIICKVAALYPEYQFIALSEQADQFWESLGWTRIDRTDSMPGRPMYVSPMSKFE